MLFDSKISFRLVEFDHSAAAVLNEVSLTPLQCGSCPIAVSLFGYEQMLKNHHLIIRYPKSRVPKYFGEYFTSTALILYSTVHIGIGYLSADQFFWVWPF